MFPGRTTPFSNAAIYNQRVITNSGTYTALEDGYYLITAIGGGGSGGCSPNTGSGQASTGGGAGGFSQKKHWLPKNSQLTIVIGAGGASFSATASPQTGNVGGDTLVSGSGISLIAYGGGAGQSQAAGAGTVAGAIGGLAAGGDINVQGGGSGTATVAAIASSKAATGGGAVGVYGVGYSSGNAESSAGFSAYSGGAGVGGGSGSATASSGNTISPGGGSAGPSANVANSTVLQGGFGFYVNEGIASTTTKPETNLQNGGLTRVLSPMGPGAVSSTIPGSCGGGGYSGSAGGLFAGGGPASGAGLGGIYGGGSSGTGGGNGKSGGNGVVIIEWFTELSK